MARILVTDDNAEIRQLLSTVLADEGHKVSVAADGEKALDSMLVDPPDVLILDLMMPTMDGYTVLKEMKSAGLRESTKVVVLTAKTSESDWVRGYKLGADSYLTKPFSMSELIEAIDGLIGMSKAEIRSRRQKELDKAQLLSRLESIFEEE